jgi:RHS repeat-associated protein
MPSAQPRQLCLYRYDPLDRLVHQSQAGTPELQRFYCKSRLATEIQGALNYSIVQHGDQLLGQQQREGDAVDTTLLATDQQRSILHTLKANHQRKPITYSPYGHRPAASGLLSLLGFNGERPDRVTGHYLLGNGYRAFNAVLMRFISPDSWSPFGKGGLNPYAYCLGDPTNLSDSDGHVSNLVANFFSRWRRFAMAKAGTKLKIEIKQIEQTNTIEMKWPYRHEASLNPGVTPMQAIQTRGRMSRLYQLDSARRGWRAKFLRDLSHEKKESVLIQKLTGVPPGQNERLKLLNYIKGGDSKDVFSSSRLFDAAEGKYDPRVPLSQRPDVNVAVRYRGEMVVEGPFSSIFSREADRIREVHFKEN